MADFADRSVEQAEVLHQHLLDNRPRLRLRATPGIDCLSCGAEIPEARRRAVPGCCLCVDCQEDADKAMGR